MSFAADWADLLTWDVVVRTRTGEDTYGNVTWSNPVTVPAHVDRTNVNVPSESGQSATLNVEARNGTVYMPVLVTVQPDDQFTFPDGQVVAVSGVTTHYDNTGAAHHLEVNWTEL